MPFAFSYLCDLLETLESHSLFEPRHTQKKLVQLYEEEIGHWFDKHRELIITSGLPLLSALFPERRSDRVYGLRESKLANLLAKVLHLGDRSKELYKWKTAGHGDLGACVEMVQKQAEMPKTIHEVTLEEIDDALQTIAARYRYSSPQVRSKSAPQHQTIQEILFGVFVRLQSREAKWFTRLILKSYLPIFIPEYMTFRSYHFLLPAILKIQSSFEDALNLLQYVTSKSTSLVQAKPPHWKERELFREASKYFKPKIGVKVGRATFFKARSTKHCVHMARNRRMSMERKYDGEYCQIHIDLSRGRDFIQIFSKSGKDSTQDRKAVHGVIRTCLRIGQADSKFSSKCILEGELLVYSDKERKILPFHKIRTHVTRSGTFLGTKLDSQPQDYEHLMIVFFDVLLLDNDVVLSKTYDERRMCLESLIDVSPGQAQLAERQEIFFSSSTAIDPLRQTFAEGIASRWEGFVLKACDEPYFAWRYGLYTACDFRGCWIKLKKDYITGLGDEADFAVIGASYNYKRAYALRIKPLFWTHFHIACLENKVDVLRYEARPRFRVMDTLSETIPPEVIQRLNVEGQYICKAMDGPSDKYEFEVIRSTECEMEVYFTKPFVVEVMGAGYEKLANTPYWTLRWPRVTKIHWDRDYLEAIGFAELQELADKAVADPIEDVEDDKLWVKKIEEADVGKRLAKEMQDNAKELYWAPTKEALVQLPTTIRKRARTDSSDANTNQSDMVGQATDPATHIFEDPAIYSSNRATEYPNQPKKSKSGENSRIQSRSPENHTSSDKNADDSPRKHRRQSRIISKSSPATTPLSAIINSSPRRVVSHFQHQHNATDTKAFGLEVSPDKIKISRSHTFPSISSEAITHTVTPPKLSRASTAPAKTSTGVCWYCPRALFRSPGLETDFGLSPPTPTACPLKDTVILLSPHVANMPYVTEDLLEVHGTPFLPVSGLSMPEAECALDKGKPIILLVDNRNEDDIAVVIKTAEMEGLEVNMYDWRLLEAVEKYERGEQRSLNWKDHLVPEFDRACKALV